MLRLLAHSAEDITVISALCQDGAVLPHDMRYDARAHRFVLLLQRYRWEADQTRTRIRCALRFEHVTRLLQRGMRKETDIHALLSILAEKPTTDEENPVGRVLLHFSGGGSLQLHVDGLEAVLEDVTDYWQVRQAPGHKPAE